MCALITKNEKNETLQRTNLDLAIDKARQEMFHACTKEEISHQQVAPTNTAGKINNLYKATNKDKVLSYHSLRVQSKDIKDNRRPPSTQLSQSRYTPQRKNTSQYNITENDVLATIQELQTLGKLLAETRPYYTPCEVKLDNIQK